MAIRRAEMLGLAEEVIKTLRDPETIKALTTTDEEGVPHTVFKNSLTVLENGYIAYMELIETSQTQRNILRSLWFRKKVSISFINPRTGITYQIKGEPYKFIVDGPLWDKFLGEIRMRIPKANPSGVWLITPTEIRNQAYEKRKEEEAKRRPGSDFWLKYMESHKEDSNRKSKGE